MLPVNYDIQTASTRLDSLIDDNIADPIPEIMFPAEWSRMYGAGEPGLCCIPYGHPTSYRLASNGAELVFRVIGVLDDFFLPPFERFRLQPDRIRFVQQMVSLTALHSASCLSDINGVHDMVDIVSRVSTVPVDDIWRMSDPVAGNIRFTNRMLTPKDNLRDQIACPISDTVDPTGTLRARSASAGFIHTDDNMVEYLRIVNDTYMETSPSSFQRGDIVEVRFAVGLFGRKPLLRMRLILRAIISMDTSFTRDAARFTPVQAEPIVAGGLKRKRILEDATNLGTKIPRMSNEILSDDAFAPPIAAMTSISVFDRDEILTPETESLFGDLSTMSDVDMSEADYLMPTSRATIA